MKTNSLSSVQKTPITVWKVLNEDKKTGKFSFVFNHIEDGWNGTNEPTPKFDIQKKNWNRQIWAGSYAWLIKDGTRLVVYQ